MFVSNVSSLSYHSKRCVAGDATKAQPMSKEASAPKRKRTVASEAEDKGEGETPAVPKKMKMRIANSKGKQRSMGSNE